jgi:steroid delta-isomerase-like uncharacterized protein
MMLISDAAVSDPRAVEKFALQWGMAWNDHDGDAVAALCHEDLMYDEPVLGETAHGRDPIRNLVVSMAAAFPDNVFSLQGLYADTRRRAVLVAWLFTGTHAATGKKVEFHGDDRLEIREDGLIGAYRCIYDYDLVLRQVGSAPLQ